MQMKQENGLQNNLKKHKLINKKIEIMKKVILTLAIALGSLSTFASTTNTATINNSITKTVQEEYTEVALDALPDAVKATVMNSFPNSKLLKAYKNEKNEYKLEISVGTATHDIFTDATGKIIKK